MKVSELGRKSGCSVPTIKYYLREGLLPSGTPTGVNQADYDDTHLHRLRLIRTLTDVGRLPLASTRAVLAALDDEHLTLHDVLGIAHHALHTRRADQSLDHPTPELAEVEAFLDGLRWKVKPGAPGTVHLAHSLKALRELGWRVDADVFRRYATAADELAAWELQQLPGSAERARTIEAAVVGAVVFESAFSALRSLAEEHHSAQRFGSRPRRSPSTRD